MIKSLSSLVIGVFILSQAPNTTTVFEVASIRSNKSGDRAAYLDDPPGGRYTATNAPLRLLILRAYGILDNQLVNAPEWTATERFDINAKLEQEPPLAPPGQLGVRELALRSLLVERFKLVVHRETREIPLYALVMERTDRKPGPMLKPSSTDCSPEGAAARIAAAQAGKPVGVCGSRFNTGRIQFGDRTLPDFARGLSDSPWLDRTIIDRTGLAGNWEGLVTFKPDRAPEPMPGHDMPAIDPNAPSLFVALQEQLGLKLEPIREPIEVLIVDRVERLAN